MNGERVNQDVVVIAERVDDRIMPVTYELIAFARALVVDDAAVCILAAGRQVRTAARELARQTGTEVVVLEGDGLASYSAEAWVAALSRALGRRKPSYICIPHTSHGCDFAPGLAVRLGASCITAVEGFRRRDGVVSFRRSLFNGRIDMHMVPETRRVVLTILPGSFNAQDARQSGAGVSPGHVQIIPVPDRSQRIRAAGVIAAEEQGVDIALADVIVSAGRGIGSRESLTWIRRLADLFPKSAVGCSRALCDMGWLGHRHQVGLTGRTVAPKLYLACGISGAVQHIAGMRDSRFVVAVNRDPRAAIFQVADVGIVEDVNTFIPLLMEKASDRAS